MKGTTRTGAVPPICWILIVVCLLAGIAGVVTISILYAKNSKLPFGYGIAVDSGSSRTNFYVYRWPTDKENGTGIAQQIYTCPSGSDKKLQPLANFAANPIDAGNQVIKPCMDKILGVIPSTDYATTPVFVGATAGMRILNAKNSSASEAIMSSVRQTLSSYPFDFSQPLKQARVIDGSEEGAFGWITSNYLSGSFGVQPSLASSRGNIGSLDMGGASTQIAFDPGHVAIDPSYKFRLTLYGYTYDIYTHSYLCYGLDEALRRYKATLVQMQNFSQTIQDPCAPGGNQTQQPFSYVFQPPCTQPPATLPAHILQAGGAPQDFVFTFQGTSDPVRCQTITRSIFNFSALCSTPPCSFDGVYQPPPAGQFYAFSGFYFATNDLGLNPATGSFSLDEYRQAMNNFCNLTWDQISGRSTSPSILVILCFQAQHIHHLLVDGYGFNDTTWSSIKFVQQINNSDFGWALGMMINSTNIIPPHEYTTGVSVDLFVIIVVISSALVLASLAMAISAIFYQRAGRLS